MKIGIMGTHGTGKSTLAFELSTDLKHKLPADTVGILSEVARLCPWSINEGVSEEAQRWIFHRQMVDELEATYRNEHLVCDRTILDSLAYSEYAGFDFVSSYLTIALNWLKTYDQLHFLRPSREIADDGFRSIDVGFQKDIDTILNTWINHYKLDIIRE